ncbi:hypothetical protein [Lysinibacillus fusiformis]|uniref:hypothetical protein n=1 Tax=Lysinibacillus fusiformis TaxID=28031 RepID=UPI003557BEEA
MINYWINKSTIKNDIFIPKYYNPEIQTFLNSLKHTHDCLSIQEMVELGYIEHSTGHEIGKHAYGTGDIPFIRTSDISNWELKTIPKQGVSREIYEQYAEKQDVREGDILLVRDGTYLIGHNCFISKIDKELIYQSHIIKIRIKNHELISPELFFIILNSDIVQQQIRSVQFTADIIDTIGQRFNQIVFPIPKDINIQKQLTLKTQISLKKRNYGKAFIKHCPTMIEDILLNGKSEVAEKFMELDIENILNLLGSDTITAEFGDFNSFIINSNEISKDIFIPKYYDPDIDNELNILSNNCDIVTFKELKEKNVLNYSTGDEIGKLAYGTGSIPFIRTSDFSNWEIKHDPKQGVSEEIYNEYAEKQNTQIEDILLVRDGTYLIGSSCIITEFDQKSLYCGGLYKIRSNDKNYLDPYLLLGLLNSYIVKRQIRTKQFTRDVIDTIGNRIDEVKIPIPKNDEVKKSISKLIKETVLNRINAREEIKLLSNQVITLKIE